MRNEADTRAELIDPKLVEAGWGVVENSFIRREVIAPGRIIGGGKRATALSSDYVLRYRGRAAGHGLRPAPAMPHGLCQQRPPAAGRQTGRTGLRGGLAAALRADPV